MNPALASMLERYSCESADDYDRALREIIQEIALLGLWRSKFYERAAFYGGSALRILHGLDRFSEDLDFSLLRPRPGFALGRYLAAAGDELLAFGFEVEVEEKIKRAGGQIRSAFIKGGTKRLMLDIRVPDSLVSRIPANQRVKVKLELDVDPPGGFETEARTLYQPVPFSVRAFSPPDLLAGKLHAVLCRRWKRRVKGRDWYDLAWFLARRTPVRLAHLEARLVQTGDWEPQGSLAPDDLLGLLSKSIDATDFRAARSDVEPFLKDPRSTDLWSPDFFQDLVRDRLETLTGSK
jgi:predicted nucleotidyltransferase component of viral defense system